MGLNRQRTSVRTQAKGWMELGGCSLRFSGSYGGDAKASPLDPVQSSPRTRGMYGRGPKAERLHPRQATIGPITANRRRDRGGHDTGVRPRAADSWATGCRALAEAVHPWEKGEVPFV